jgi:hypothetical protein
LLSAGHDPIGVLPQTMDARSAQHPLDDPAG